MKFPRIPMPRLGAGLLAAGLLVLVPLIFSRSFPEQFSFVKTFITKLLLVLGSAAWALGLVWGKLRWPRHFRLGPSLAALGLAVLLSCANSPVPAFSLEEAEYFLCGPLWACLLVCWGEGEATVRFAALLTTAAGVAIALIAILQWLGFDLLLFGGYQIEWGAMVSRMRLYSTLGNPNFLAGYLIGGIFPALALGISSTKRWVRAAGFASAAVMAGAIVGARSRGALAGLLAGLAVAALVSRRRATPVSPALPAVRDTGNVAEARSFLLPPLFWLGALLVGKLIEAQWEHLEGRVYLWRCAWPMFLDHPLMGAGWGTFQLRFLDLQARFLAHHPDQVYRWSNIRQLHNDPLQLLLETGLVGLLAFGWVLGTFGADVRKALSHPSARFWVAASAGGVAALLFDSFFNFQFAVPPTFLLLFTLIAFPALMVSGSTSRSSQPVSPSAEQVNAGLPHESRGLRTFGVGAAPQRVEAARVLASLAVIAAAVALLALTTCHVAAERDYASALHLEDEGKLDRAAETYRHGVSLNPLNGRLHFGLARVLYLQGRNGEALSEALLADRTYQDSHLVVLTARIQEQMGLGTAALETYRRALALDPTLTNARSDIQRLESR